MMFLNIPEDCLINVFLPILTLDCLGKLAQTNSEFNRICLREDLWKKKFLLYFTPRLVQVKSWKQTFKLHIDPILYFRQNEDELCVDLTKIRCSNTIDTHNSITKMGGTNLVFSGTIKVYITKMGSHEDYVPENILFKLTETLKPYFINYNTLNDRTYISYRRPIIYYCTEDKSSITRVSCLVDISSQLTLEIIDLLRND